MRPCHWLLSATLALLFAGCNGVAALSFTGAEDEGPGLLDPGPDDEEMRGQDPDLFAIASRYFPSEEAVAARTRIFRLTRKQLDLTSASLFPQYSAAPLSSALPQDPLQTNYEYAENLAFSGANFTPYNQWVEKLTTTVRDAPGSVIDCAQSNNSPACLEDKARAFLVRAFRGTASQETLDKYTQFFLASVPEVGLPTATADLVDVTLSAPGFLYRDEVLTDDTGVLRPAQQLQQLSYALADAPPEALGFTSASPELHVGSPEALSEAVDAVLASELGRQKLQRFFTAWLEVKESDTFTIEPSVFPEFTPQVAAAAVEDTRRFLEHHLSQATPKLGDITQSTRSFVSRAMAPLYGLPTNTNPDAPVELDRSKRLGLFTQPAVLASHSGPTTTRLVKRGVFFTRKVMCLPLGGVPSGIDTSVPEGEVMTERQKIETVTSQASCAGCHDYINPFGFMQENYDAIGRWRETDEGLPVDPGISVKFLDEGPFATSSPVEAIGTFTRSLRFKQCFVRQLFRFYMGRDETPADDPLLRKMFFTFAKDDELVGLLQLLATAPHFTARGETP